ncbi:MAG: hypothetical protein LC659_03270, partial [Myxococcales bacterium]|nr:hypothetical protein [Myxococcales bacterium]
EEAYRIKPLALLLFDIAQAARLAGEPKKALTFYALYLEKVPRAAEREECLRRISELQAAVAAADRPPPRAEPTPPKSVAAAAVVAPATLPPARPSRRWWRDPCGAVLVAVGVAAVGVGGGIAGWAQHTIDGANASYGAFDAAKGATTLRTAGLVTLGVGGALVIAAAVRYAVAARHR